MREQIKKELNNIAWVFESQSMNASKVVECPLLHNNGSFLFKYFHITSDEKLFELEEYFNYYTKRFEETINPGLLINELSAILKKCTLIKKYEL